MHVFVPWMISQWNASIDWELGQQNMTCIFSNQCRKAEEDEDEGLDDAEMIWNGDILIMPTSNWK